MSSFHSPSLSAGIRNSMTRSSLGLSSTLVNSFSRFTGVTTLDTQSRTKTIGTSLPVMRPVFFSRKESRMLPVAGHTESAFRSLYSNEV